MAYGVCPIGLSGVQQLVDSIIIERKNYMKYLTLTSDENKIYYNLPEIDKISHDYAKNVLSESDVWGNGLKPLEVVMVIKLKDGNTATLSATRWKMHFE